MANAKRIPVILGFTADTAQAKRQMQDLQNSLNSIINTTNSGARKLGITGDLNEAAIAAASLKSHIESALNPKTGTLDFSKFNRSIKQSGQSLQTYSNTLLSMGPAGEKAFMQLAQAVASSEIPLRRANELVDGLWDSLKRTAKWQFSSSAIHGLVGSFQTAYNYSKDLNKSLNNIRIVTSQSTEQMAEFAKEANKAAKNLSASTLDYTDAALIYYQQGLSNEEVQKRTDATIKMANVTGENAESVSSYMTAIWNNFDNGSKSLEYYADVITALGAATASSSEEIAGGLEKFSAVAEQIGLSYEYATSALATVVSATRQSEDVVGTSFKTIFSRLQGVQLGETLEDGVTLNKYSEALAKVGIQITGTNGQLKDMDQILNEMGERWDSLSESQQTALAQTVGGVRQYTNLVALMKNWDTFQENLLVAYGSEGTLQEQSDIYAEGWEAARKRVQAALESIYQKLMDDEGFIALLNVGEDFLNIISKMIDGLGGVQGVLSTIGLLATKVFNKQLVESISAVVYNLQGPKKAQEDRQNYLKFAADLMYSRQEGSEGNETPEQKSFLSILTLQNKLIESASSLNEVENHTNTLLLDRYRLLSNNVLEIKKAEKAAEENYKNTKDQAHKDIVTTLMDAGEVDVKKITNAQKQYDEQFKNLAKLIESQNNIDGNWNEITKLTGNKEYYDKRSDLNEDDKKTALWIAMDKTTKAMNDLGVSDKTISKLIEEYTLYNTLKNRANELTKEEEELYKKLDSRFDLDARNERQKKYNELLEEEKALKAEGKKLDEDKKKLLTELSPEFEASKAKTDLFAESVVATAQAFTSLSSIASITKGIFATMSNDSMSFGEKLLTIAGSIGMLLPMILQLVSSYKQLTTLITGETVATGINTVAKWLNAAATKASKDATDGSKKSIKEHISAIKEETKVLTKKNIEIWKSKWATSKIGEALGGLVKAVGAFLKAWGGWIAFFTIVIGAITAFIHLWKTEWSPEAKLKKATEATELMANAVKKANEEYNTLITTIDGFDDSYEKIQNMTKGTIEWQQAVNSLNADIGNLIKKYPELAQYVEYDDNGVQRLTEKGQELAKQLEYQNVVNAENAKISAEGIQRNAQIKDAKSNLGIAAIGWADELELLSSLGVTDLSNISESVQKKTGITGERLKALQDGWKTEEKQAYLDALNQDRVGDIADAKSLIGLNSDISSQIFGENSTIPEFMRSALMEEVAKAVNEKLDSGKYDNKATLTEEEKQKIAENGDLLYENGKFYKKKEDGTKGDKVDISDQLERASAQKAVMQDINIEDYFKAAWDNAASLSHDAIEGIAEKYDANRAASVKSGFDEEDLKILEQYKEHLQKTYEIDEKMAERVAVANMNFNKGLEDIIENYEDYYNSLTKSEKGTEDYATALNAVKKDFSQILDLNLEDISDEFATSEENLNLMKEAAEGNLEALTQLRANAALDVVADVKVNEEGLQSDLDFLKAQIALNEEFTFGTSLDNTKFYDALTALYENGAMTIEETQKLLNSLGFEPEIDYEQVDLKSLKGYKGEVMVSDGEGGYKVATQEMLADETQTFYIPKINGSKTTYRGAPKTIINSNNQSKIDKNAGSKKDKKKASDEIDRYHVIKEQLEDIEQELDRISEAKDRAFGGEKLRLMDEEIAKTREMAEAQEEYLRQINANHGPDRAALEKYGAKFDANGALINYDSLMNAQINKFNASLTDEAEEEFNNFKELIEQYEETDDLLAEERQKLTELQNEIFDLMLEKLEYEVTLKIDVNEDANKYLDFLMELAGDGMEHALDNIDMLGEKIANGLEDIQTYTDALNKMFKNRGYEGDVVSDLQSGKVTPEELAEMYDLTEDEVDLLREYMGDIMDITEEIQNMRKEITDQLIDAMEEINEKFDEQIDKINRAAEGMQHYRDIIDLVGQDVLGISDEMIEMFSEKQLNNSIANVFATRTKMLENEREYNEAVAELERLKDTGASEFAIEEQERVVEAAREHLYDSTNEFNSAWKDALEQAREHFDTIIEQITTAFEEAMSGIYGNLDALQDAYDRQSEINERYLEDYEKIYELSKLNRDIGNSIDDTDSIRAKQALLELQEEINALEESGAEISKYDLDFLRQKYELRLAEIALEEAQNAKSQVRMTRNSEGNWNYTYTANEENISKAEQNYEDALYKTQQLTTDYIKDLENRIFQLNTDLVNALSNIDPNDAEGRQRIYDYYMGQNNYLTSQLNNALGNNADIYNQDWMNYSNATGYKISDNEKWMDSFNETTLSMLTGYSSLGDYQNAFRDSSLLMYNSINDAASEFAANTEIVMNAAGTSIETFAKDAEEAFKNFTFSTKEATDSIDGIDKEAKETFDAILEKLVEFNKAYDEQIQKTIESNNNLIKSFNELIKKESEAKAAQAAKANNFSSSSGGETPTGSTNTRSDTTKTKMVEYWTYDGNTYSSKKAAESARQTEAIMQSGGAGGHVYDSIMSSSILGPYWKSVQLDTGGYTGAWGTTAGKLAMLHEKELVLNKQDTENILQSVSLVRQISDWISGRVNAMQYGSMLSAFGLPGDNKNVLEQMVTIHAEFPNANNRAEIEAAFDNLVNRAAQYAYRK